ncbi:PREDICTED: uncharacterized protein LOC104613517 [Nelumbo nucifera]|uniref:Uncharacterized protein LOC104613517 n=1 Tax=Nelumbo nucifera TaxID=4432 RepID=A0A1U8QCL1_NELNU|nr:PREDICTED: uncharacterized protein LOC104613517 [Nelumbo nucifera]
MFMMNNLQVDKRIGVGGDPPSQLSQTTHSGTDWNWRLVVDASSFFLVEATGDSEADCDPIGTTAGNEFSTVDDDDAESCTSDSCSSEFINGNTVHESFNGFGDDDDNADGSDEDDGLSDISSGGAKSRDEGQDGELMNEMEKSKLFWETCLAS